MRDLWKRAFGAIALLLVVLLALAPGGTQTSVSGSCLLYTSDAADE